MDEENKAVAQEASDEIADEEKLYDPSMKDAPASGQRTDTGFREILRKGEIPLPKFYTDLPEKKRRSVRIAAVALLFVLTVGISLFAAACISGTFDRWFSGNGGSSFAVDQKLTYEVNDEASLRSLAESASPETDAKTLTDYFVSWRLPYFQTAKLTYLSKQVAANFYKPLPETCAWAKQILSLFLENDYAKIELTDSEAVTNALLTELVATLDDKYAYYRVEEEYQNYTDELSGTFYGIGVVVNCDYVLGTMQVTEVMLDSPAEKAGVLVGDFIESVDGVHYDDPDETVSKMRGKEGAEVKVGLKRGEEHLEVTAVRAKIDDRSVTLTYAENTGDLKIAVLRITSFKDNTDEQFIEAVERLEAEEADAVVFDLHSNFGGYLTSVVNMISYLVPNGTRIVSYNIRGNEVVIDATDGEKDHVLSIPCAVICNEYTASAAEIFTAALRDYRDFEGKALIDSHIVGTNSYGKGIMQDTFPYGNSAITLTVSYYNPPCGQNYHGTGILPDEVVGLEEKSTAEEYTEEFNMQLDAAVNYLKAKLSASASN